MAQKPSVPKGTRDMSPEEMARRQYVFSVLRDAFSRYGFSQIETPSFENLSTLMGKYGEEGDRLIFKILNSGDYLEKAPGELLSQRDSLHLTRHISEKALRYDLTVPFARYVVQHQGEITFPFKRFQMQPVWRADRPQKGRFREFYQCDADVVGSKSLWQEVELVQLYDEVFSSLGIPVSVRINNRKILSGLAEVTGQPELIVDMTVALDKLDKIGEAAVAEEMLSRGLTEKSVETVRPFMRPMTEERMWELLSDTMKDSQTGRKGMEELRFIFDAVGQLGLRSATLDLDLTLARGLNYYTGAIFEVKAKGVEMGSIGGGGRYDDLTGIFGLKGVSGVGISFGMDRICIVMDELGLFPAGMGRGADVMFANMGENEALYSMKALSVLRRAGVRAEMYPDAVKLGRQLDYANKKNIPFVAIAGTSEIEQGVFTVKDMTSGTQETVTSDSLALKFGRR
ncbi:MAG: histidine--tRNA ligase [Flavobacteriales bacterium]|nr:MAG: histidine--tRNA ligase [Flavobacteriales bacterium]